MTIRTFPNIEQGSAEWLKIRRGIITASVIGQLITQRHPTAIDYPCSECGANPSDPCVGKKGAAIQSMHKVRAAASRNNDAPPKIVVARGDDVRSLTLQLAAERITGHTDQVFVSDDMMRGTLHEPIARDKYAEHNGVEVQQVGFVIREDWGGIQIGASPDGFVGDDGGIEIKCPRAKTHIQTILSGEVPAYNMAQVMTCLLVTGREWWDFISFSAGLPMWTKRVTLDPKWRDSIITAATSAEHAITSMVQRWERATADLPTTEYVPDDMEMTF